MDWVVVFKNVMGFLMLAAFAHFVWAAVIRRRGTHVDFGDAGFEDETSPEKGKGPDQR